MKSEYNDALVLEQDGLYTVIEDVLEKLNKILICSYGPLGKNTIIHKNGVMPVVTKDGLTILRSIKFDERAQYDIYQLIKSVSSGLVDKVGDGSTSAVLSAINIYLELKETASKFKTIKDFDNTIKLIQEIINLIYELFLTKRLESLDNIDERTDVLSLIAAISNNNDSSLGREIAEIMSKLSSESIVLIKDNPKDNSESITHSFVNGFQTKNYRLTHPVYFNGSNNKNNIEISNGALVVMSYNFTELHYNYIIQNIIPNLAVVLPIVVICETPEKAVVTQIVKDAMTAINNNKVPSIFLLETGGLNNKGAMDTFSDLEAYLGCNASAFNSLESISSPLPEFTFGAAGRVVFFPNSTTTFDLGLGVTKELDIYYNRIENIEQELSELSSNQKVSRGALRSRLNRLNGMNVTIFVGGRTQEEKESLSYLIDDSVLACKSVMRHGYTVGGNYSTYFALQLLDYLFFKLRNNTLDEFLSDTLTIYNKSRNNEGISEESVELSNKLKELLHELFNLPVNISDIIKQLNTAFSNVVNIPKAYQNFPLIESVLDIDDNYNVTYSIHNTFSDKEESFNLLNTENTINVISPIQTDKEILNASLSIVTLLLTSNQYIQ